MVTVPVEDFPPVTEAGLREMDMSVGELIVSVAPAETTPVVPVTSAMTCVATATVLTVKLAEVLLAAIATVLGTVADFTLLWSFTTMPPFGAGPESITVPLDEAPPATEGGFNVMDWIAVGRIASEVASVIDLSFTTILAVNG